MTTKPLARRLARLEQAYGDWVASLSDDELDTFLQRIPPDERAAFDAMTDDELERLADGRMQKGEWRTRLQRARHANGT